MSETPEVFAKFKYGDLVRHRASKKLGIVVNVCVSCNKHGYCLVGIKHDATCVFKPNGYYTISLSFNSADNVTISGDLLENSTNE